MDKKLLTLIAVLGLLVLLYFITVGLQNRHSENISKIFSIKQENASKIVISSNQDAIELIKIDTTWEISGNDTLKIKKDAVNNLFDRMSDLEKQHLVTSKEENWDKYNISPEKGIHLAFINKEGNTSAYYVFGRSLSEYNRCYVRIDKNSDVYLLNKNIIYQLQVTPTFWGEVPTPLVDDEAEDTH